MILGLSVEAFTKLHVIISLIGIIAGMVWLAATLAGRRLNAVTALFLVTTILTSATGFLFHSKAIGPPHILGVLSLVILAATLYALYVRRAEGVWRAVYVGTATAALYFNWFVLVVQAFGKIPALHALAPKGNEPPFAVAQGVVLVAFVALGWLAVRRGRAA